MSALSARATVNSSGTLLRFFSWQGLGAAVLGVLLAKWMWLLLAPSSTAIPAAAWEGSGEAGQVFGTASTADAATQTSVSGIKLIGVFAHPSKGFAVMQVDEKQLGVGLGDEVKPGLRLVETHADYVMLEQAGVRQRVELSSATAPGGPVSIAPGSGEAGATKPAGAEAAGRSTISPSVAQPAPSYAPPATPPDAGAPASPAATPPGLAAGVTQGQVDMMQHKLDAATNLPPEQRDMMRQKLEMMRGSH